MAALPAHTRNYFTRGNQPFPSTANQAAIENFWIWALYANLTNVSTLGATGGSRAGSSTWIARGGSNAASFSAITAPGVANPTAQALWGGGTYNAANHVRAASGTNHSWMLVENTTLGYELLINMSTSAGQLGIVLVKSGQFTTGTGTLALIPTGPSSPVCMNQTALDVNGGPYSFFGDTGTFLGTNYFHFTCADNGEFHCEMSRVSTGVFTSYVAVWRTTGQPVGDTNNTFLFASDSTGATGRGVPQAARIFVTGYCAGRLVNNNLSAGGGIIAPRSASGDLIMAVSSDQNTGLTNAAPCDIIHVGTASTAPWRRGTLPDLYIAGAGPVGYSIPDVATQIRTQIGEIIHPFITVAPLI